MDKNCLSKFNLYIFVILLLNLSSSFASVNLIQNINLKLTAKSYLLQDFHSGQILFAKNIHQRLEPASLTKLMTAYIIYLQLQNNTIKPNQKVKISKKAWKAKGSRMFIEVGSKVLVKDLLKGIIVQSGNDASIAMAELISDTEENFAILMNYHAKRIGMNNSHFTNSTGLPHPQHYSTAYDLAILTRRIINDFPQYYKNYAEKTFTFNNITQHNRNKLLWHYDFADGVKTGHTSSAGFCLIASAMKNDMRLVSVLLGVSSNQKRTTESKKLLNFGFQFYKTYKLYPANSQLKQNKIWLGNIPQISLALLEPLYVTVPTGQYDKLSATMNIPSILKAPIKKNTQLGHVTVFLDKKELIKRPLVALETVPKGSIISRYKDHLLLFIKKTFN